jgi:hypothetical protein
MYSYPNLWQYVRAIAIGVGLLAPSNLSGKGV